MSSLWGLLHDNISQRYSLYHLSDVVIQCCIVLRFPKRKWCSVRRYLQLFVGELKS